jgi:seryl-tRNA synthetase
LHLEIQTFKYSKMKEKRANSRFLDRLSNALLRIVSYRSSLIERIERLEKRQDKIWNEIYFAKTGSIDKDGKPMSERVLLKGRIDELEHELRQLKNGC